MLQRIESALEDIRQGKIVIVVDDEDRENEGDFIIAAKHATPEVVNFMSKHGRGLICIALLEERCDALGLELMVNNNTALHETAFTVSVDLLGHGCTSGISAHDRAKTIEALIDPATDPNDFGKPGHIFPLRAKKGGVLRRAGHTEAAVDLARLAGMEPAGVLVEIMNEDGSMARLPDSRSTQCPHRHRQGSFAVHPLLARPLSQILQTWRTIPSETPVPGAPSGWETEWKLQGSRQADFE